MIRLVALSLFLAQTVLAEPQTRPPENPGGAKASLLSSSHYTVAGVQASRNVQETVTTKLGAAPISAGPHHSERVCYVGPTGSRVVFETAAVGFGYSAFSPGVLPEPPLDCVESIAVERHVPNGAGLRLGLSESEILQLLGQPTRRRTDRADYHFWLQVEVSENERPQQLSGLEGIVWLDVYSGIGLTFQDGRVVSYAIFTTKTY